MNSTIYEINTRVWIKKFATSKIAPKLIDIPSEYWKTLADKGIKYIWLMGIWDTVPEAIEKYCFTDGLISEYDKALPNWTKEDVIGSPYAIDSYTLNRSLASDNELVKLKRDLNDLGLKIILDFIPNHFSAESSLINSDPEIFMRGNEELLSKDAETYFKAYDGNIYAHGRDPNFPAWQDTIQVNYFSDKARSFMINSLKNISEICDGVRCDMAMLPMTNIFKNTWEKPIEVFSSERPKEEFWIEAIEETKKNNNDFIFIAESYWESEWQLQQLGFDLTYDKKLLDRLECCDAEIILNHLQADKEYQQKSIRFLENHDEERAVYTFGIEKSKASAVIVSTILGTSLFHDGQFEGRNARLPVQLGREPVEEINNSLIKFYDKLLHTVNNKIFMQGTWNPLVPIQLDEDPTFKNVLAWEWHLGSEKRIVVINYSDLTAYCRIKFNVNREEQRVTLIDLLSDTKYDREVNEIENLGLFIDLKAFESHIFSIG